MADSSTDLSALQDAVKKVYQPKEDALTQQYQSALNTGKQQLSQIPSQYDPQRAAAALTQQQASSAMPESVLNQGQSIGANGNSGLAYSMGKNIANTYQNALSTIGKSQNSAITTKQQSLDDLTSKYQTNLGDLQSQEASGEESAMQQWNNAVQAEKAAEAKAQYDTELAKYKAALEAQNNAAKIAAQEKLAEYNAQVSAAKSSSSSSKSSGSSSSSSSKSSKSAAATVKAPTTSEFTSALNSFQNMYAPGKKLTSNASYSQLESAIDSLPWDTNSKINLMKSITVLDPVTHGYTSFYNAYQEYNAPNNVSGYKAKK